MKKLKMDLNGIGELLNKEQMKMVTGGDNYFATYVSCTYRHWVASQPAGDVTIGHDNVTLASNDCYPYCNSMTPPSGSDTYTLLTCYHW